MPVPDPIEDLRERIERLEVLVDDGLAAGFMVQWVLQFLPPTVVTVGLEGMAEALREDHPRVAAILLAVRTTLTNLEKKETKH